MKNVASRRRAGTETLFKILLLLFLLMLLWIVRDYPEESRLFPVIIFVITIVLILVTFLQSLFTGGEEPAKRERLPERAAPSGVPAEPMRKLKELEEQGEKDAGLEPLEKRLARKRSRQSAAIILIALVIGYLGGFLLTVPFYFLAFGALHGKREHTKRYILIAVGVTAVIYFSLSYLMGVPLLRGLYWG